MDPQLEELLKRIERLSDEFAELRDGIHKAVRVADDDPEMALIRARKVMEYIIRNVFERRVHEPPGTRPLENLIQRLVKDGHLPARLEAYTETIRKLGNVGAHRFGEAITAADVNVSLTQLLPILVWYFEIERPDSGWLPSSGPRGKPKPWPIDDEPWPPGTVSDPPRGPLHGRNWAAIWAAIAAGVILIGISTLLVALRSRGPGEATRAAADPAPAEAAVDRAGVAGERPAAPPPDRDHRPPARPAGVTPDGFVPLFNGKDTSGWTREGGPMAAWKVEKGILVGSTGPGYASVLQTDRSDFMNFHLRVQTTMADGRDSTIKFRIDDSDPAHSKWFFVVIPGTRGQEGKARHAAGTLAHAATLILPTFLAEAAPAVALRPGEWFDVEIMAVGDVFSVLIRGVEVVKSRARRPKAAPGPIGLHCPIDSTVRFRKVEIKKLSDTARDASSTADP
jgi:hypothetical protein